MDKFSVNASTKFTVLKELNSEFALVKIKVMATGKNRNMSYFSKEVVEKHLNSLNYVPVVAHLFKNDDGEYRIGGHDMYIDWEDWSIKSLCVPFGVVKADTFEWETINEYGTDVEYLTCEAVLWVGRYPELKETIYSDEVWFNHSMEVDCKEYRPLESDSNYLEVLDFEFSALCLLYKSDNRDENVTPCFISADVTPVNFSADDFVEKMNEMKQAMSEVFAFGDKEGENMNENENGVIENGTQDNPENFSNEGTEPNNETQTVPVDFEILYNDSLKTIDGLTIKIAEFETEIEGLKAQVADLAPYKLAVEKAEREKAENEIFAKYDDRIGGMPEYKALKEKSCDYELEQLDRECMILVGKFAMNTFALNDTKTKKAESIRFTAEGTSSKVSPYGDIFERYGNND